MTGLIQRISTILLCLILLAACNRIDTAFVEAIQAGISKAGENREAFETHVKKARELFEKIEKAPQGLKNNPQFGYADLYGRVIQLHDACNSMIVNQEKMVSTVEGILTDYTEGKMKKEEALPQVDLLLKNFEGYHFRVRQMENFLKEAEKTYDEMLARWEALPEAEKIASAKMPAPKLPDASNLRGGSTLLSTGTAPSPASSQPVSPGVLAPSGSASQSNVPTSLGTSAPGSTPPQGGATSPASQQQQTGKLAPTPQQQQTGTLVPTPQQQQTGTLVPPKREQ